MTISLAWVRKVRQVHELEDRHPFRKDPLVPTPTRPRIKKTLSKGFRW